MRIQTALLGVQDAKGRFSGGALQNLEKQAVGLIEAAGGAVNAAGRAVKEGKDLKDVGKAAVEGGVEGAKTFVEGSKGLGKQLQGVVTGGKGGTSPESEFAGLADITKPQTAAARERQYEAFELFMEAEDPTDVIDKIMRAAPSAEKPATPEVSSTSAAPSAATDRTVTAEARRDPDGNFTATGQDTQTNQTINVVLKVDGRLLADTVLEQQMTNQPLPASSVGGNIRNNATA